MIERIYMGNDGRRDHSFRVPRPDLAGATGGPDACTDCHQNRDPGWAAETVRRWFPDDTHRRSHYGETLAHGREDAVSAAGDLADLATDTSEPGIVRATALWLLEQSNSASTAQRLTPLLADPDPLVRAAAVGVQRAAPPEERVRRVSDLLADPVRNVRTAAVRVLLDAPIAGLPDDFAADLRAARSEWQMSLANRLDFPETQLQIAGIALTMRDFASATGAFREAIRLDPQRVDAWAMLVRLAAAIEGNNAARAVMSDALAFNPEDPSLRGMAQDMGLPLP